MSAPALLAILTNRPPSIPAGRFDAWYVDEHIPERLETPGFLWAARYVSDGAATPEHLALYGLSAEDVLTSGAYKKLLDKANWSSETAEIFPAIAAINQRLVLKHVGGAIPGDEKIALRLGKLRERDGEAWVAGGKNRGWYRSVDLVDCLFAVPGSLPPGGEYSFPFRRTYMRHA